MLEWNGFIQKIKKASLMWWMLFLFSFSAITYADLVEDFIKLQDQLPQAVCDQTQVSRPPFLKFPETEKSILESHAQAYFTLEHSIELPEALHILLQNESPLLSAQGITTEKTKKSDEPVDHFKRKISQEFCVALLSQEKQNHFIQDKKNWILELSTQKPQSGKQAFGVEDMEGRFLRNKNTVYVGGWIEPHEVVSFVDLKGFKIKKLIHPLTRETQSIVLLGLHEEPLGFFQVKNKDRAPSSELLMRKRLDLYQSLIENEAYRTLFGFEDQSIRDQKKEKIKKTKEFYLNLVQAFHIFPENPQFQTYSGKVKLQDHKSVEDYIQKNQTHLNEVEFQPLPRDEKLLAIFNEYLNQLKKI